jgi:hypothetical protein
MKQRCGVFIFLIFGMLGCNYSKIKALPIDEVQKFSLPEEKISELSYSLLNQKVFLPKCISCHSSSDDVSLETYPEIIKNLASIKRAVFDERKMPKRGSLSDEELSYLWNWIQIGAPEQAQNGHTEPTPELILPTYDSINKNVFQTSCKDCHNPAGSGKRILFDRDSLLNSPLELVIPNNPDESGLVLAIERTDSKRMPPAKEGYSALKDDAKIAIRKWIESGAKD